MRKISDTEIERIQKAYGTVVSFEKGSPEYNLANKKLINLLCTQTYKADEAKESETLFFSVLSPDLMVVELPNRCVERYTPEKGTFWNYYCTCLIGEYNKAKKQNDFDEETGRGMFPVIDNKKMYHAAREIKDDLENGKASVSDEYVKEVAKKNHVGQRAVKESVLFLQHKFMFFDHEKDFDIIDDEVAKEPESQEKLYGMIKSYFDVLETVYKAARPSSKAVYADLLTRKALQTVEETFERRADVYVPLLNRYPFKSDEIVKMWKMGQTLSNRAIAEKNGKAESHLSDTNKTLERNINKELELKKEDFLD